MRRDSRARLLTVIPLANYDRELESLWLNRIGESEIAYVPRYRHMFIVIVSSLLLIALTTLIHYEVLRGLHAALPQLRIPIRTKLLVVIFGTFLAHAAEIGLYAVSLFALIRYMDVGSLAGEGTANFLDCLYFSAETYTSLGLGDVAPLGPVRLLAGVEALNGLLLIAWSASFAYLSMEKFWTKARDQRDK